MCFVLSNWRKKILFKKIFLKFKLVTIQRSVGLIEENARGRAPGWLSWLSLRLLVSAQLMISWLGGGVPAPHMEPTWDSLSPSLSLPLPHSLICSISLSQKKNNK